MLSLLENPRYIPGTTPASNFLDLSPKSPLVQEHWFTRVFQANFDEMKQGLDMVETVTNGIFPNNVDQNLRVIFDHVLKSINNGSIDHLSHMAKSNKLTTNTGEIVYSYTAKVVPYVKPEIIISPLDHFQGVSLTFSDYSSTIDPVLYRKRFVEMKKLDDNSLRASFFTRVGKRDNSEKPIESPLVFLGFKESEQQYFSTTT